MDLLTRISRWGWALPDKVAFRSGGRSMTWGELIRRANALAAHLVRVLPDDRAPVALVGHKEAEMLVGFLGVAKARHPYVPIDSSIPSARVASIVRSAGAPVTLTPTDIARLSEIPGEDPVRPATSSDPHYIMFTSGSTGDPKGVVITRGCVENFLSWMETEHHFEPGRETFLNQVVYSFDVSVMDTWTSLLTGGTIVSLTRDQITNPRQLYAALGESDVTVWVSTPTFAQVCLAERSFGPAMLPRVRRFMFCGETLPPEVAGALLDRFPDAEVWNTYGPTEATVATSSVRATRDLLARYSPLPIGYSMPGSRLLALNPQGRPVEEGERGELVIVGPNVSPGYLNRPDLTSAAFFTYEGQPAYRTGDWGYVEDGLVFFLGRMDGQIKLHGYRLELGDVEAHIAALPGVRSAVVLPVQRDGRIDSLTAFVVLGERPAGSEREIGSQLRSQLSKRVPEYMLPRKFRILEGFPMNANGKTDRRKLAELITVGG